MNSAGVYIYATHGFKYICTFCFIINTNLVLPSVLAYFHKRTTVTDNQLINQAVNLLDDITVQELECGPMPNVMVALPNIGGALCSTPQSLADAHC